jgi:arylsulfatase B
MKSFFFFLCSLGAVASSQKLNILLIVADDLGYADLSHTKLTSDSQTPNIDHLAKHGVRFSNAYATSPICNASRTGLITGSYQQRQGNFWYGGPGLHDNHFQTIPELLQKQGYRTALIGKYHYGWNDKDKNHRSYPNNHGFDYFYGFQGGRKHFLIHEQKQENLFMQNKKDFKRSGQSLQKGGMLINKKIQDQVGFATELFGAEARKFMSLESKQPFFVQLSFNAVHNFTHQLPQAYLTEHKLKGYRDWNPTKEKYYDWYKQGRYPNNPEGRAHYLGHIHYLDKEIGKITSFLEEHQLIKNTLIIFVSDNGGSTPIYANNGHLRGGKYTLFEGGIRIPMIFSYPSKYSSNLSCDQIVSAMDIMPTICHEVNLKLPIHSNGKNLSRILQGDQKATAHQSLIWDTRAEIAVRSGKWKLKICKNNSSMNYEMVDNPLGEFLFNLDDDPSEKVNLRDSHPEVFASLKKIHQKWSSTLEHKNVKR